MAVLVRLTRAASHVLPIASEGLSQAGPGCAGESPRVETPSGLAAGGKDHGAPGLRADYSPKYYAAFLIDPDGNNVEAVCLR